jgi:XTP/dITP diphosphohydrolase
MSLPPELLIATGNRGKSAEISLLLSDLPLMLRDLSHFGISTDIEETGNTFAENAELKAVGYALLAGIPAIADDSGLVVDALDGRPGVHSARYAGAEASDEARINKLLGELKYVSIERRTARFICTVALADSTQKVHGVVYGVCEGTIVDAPRGELGFGYDPIFQPHGFEQTFGELESEIKNRISHRALAFQKIVPFLRGFFKL